MNGENVKRIFKTIRNWKIKLNKEFKVSKIEVKSDFRCRVDVHMFLKGISRASFLFIFVFFPRYTIQ